MSSELFKKKNKTGKFTFSSNLLVVKHWQTNCENIQDNNNFNNSEKKCKVNLLFTITQNYQTKWWNE